MHFVQQLTNQLVWSWLSATFSTVKSYTVKLDFKNCQDKNQLGFKNHITNDQTDQISFKDRQDKNNLTLRTKMAMTKNVLKVKFDCTKNKVFKKDLSFVVKKSWCYPKEWTKSDQCHDLVIFYLCQIDRNVITTLMVLKKWIIKLIFLEKW